MDYKALVAVFAELDKTTKRLEKTYILSQLLKKTSVSLLPTVCLLLQGRIFSGFDSRETGVAANSVLKAIAKATGHTEHKIEEQWSKLGDLGNVTEGLLKKKKQATLFKQHLSVKKVITNLQKLAEATGHGAVNVKINLIAELLASASPEEGKYVIKAVLGELRLGVADGTLRDAIVWAFLYPKAIKLYDKKSNAFSLPAEDRQEYNNLVQAVQRPYDLLHDFGEVAIIAKERGLAGLNKVKIKVGVPIKVMLFPKAENIKDAFERVGTPAAFEYKYDGFRIQIHKKGKKVWLYTRRLENVSNQFPDVVEAVKKYVKADDIILDGEAVGYKEKRYLPFQEISQRIRRKYDIEKLAKALSVEVNVFDVLYHDGQHFFDMPFKERRKKLPKFVREHAGMIRIAEQLVTDNEKKARLFYEEALMNGQEGLMVKSLEGAYTPGKRVGDGVKLKPVMEPLDLVIVGAEHGTGKRAGWLSSFLLACQKDGEYLVIGKVGTGIKEKGEGTFEELTELLKPLITKKDGRQVTIKPKIVVEILYEEIQKSPTYSSGFALRFPRVVRLRSDKPASEVATLKEVKLIFSQQTKRSKIDTV